MGMFDWIKSEIPLPDGWSGELQTKQFCCQMATHVITADGRLMLDLGRHEEVPESERPYPDAEDWRGLVGCLRWVPNPTDANFHGYVYFGGLEKVGEGTGIGGVPRTIYKEHDYKAKFTDGRLVGIELDPD